MVLNGGQDKPHIRAQAELLAHLREARAERIEGAGHLANLDRPEQYTAAVLLFARAVRAPPD
jgi:pimeloyl-ACP methyl ester carboxylesterase